MNTPCRASALAGAAAAFALLSGCVSEVVKNPAGIPAAQVKADDAGSGAGAEAEPQDLVTVADKMAREIVRIPKIARARSTPHVEVEPMLNNTSLPLDEEAILTRIRVMLNSKAMNKVRFLDRAMMARFHKEQQIRVSGEAAAAVVPAVASESDSSDAVVPAPPAGDTRGPDYFLTGQLEGTAAATSAGAGDYFRYSCRLTDARTGAVVWRESYKVKKEGLVGAVFR